MNWVHSGDFYQLVEPNRKLYRASVLIKGAIFQLHYPKAKMLINFPTLDKLNHFLKLEKLPELCVTS